MVSSDQARLTPTQYGLTERNAEGIAGTAHREPGLLPTAAPRPRTAGRSGASDRRCGHRREIGHLRRGQEAQRARTFGEPRQRGGLRVLATAINRKSSRSSAGRSRSCPIWCRSTAEFSRRSMRRSGRARPRPTCRCDGRLSRRGLRAADRRDAAGNQARCVTNFVTSAGASTRRAAGSSGRRARQFGSAPRARPSRISTSRSDSMSAPGSSAGLDPGMKPRRLDGPSC